MSSMDKKVKILVSGGGRNPLDWAAGLDWIRLPD